MDLFSHQQIIKVWINSCTTSEQVDLLVPFINEFVIPKFEKLLETKDGEDKKVLAYDLEVTKVELVAAIQTRKVILAGTTKHSTDNPINDIS